MNVVALEKLPFLRDSSLRGRCNSSQKVTVFLFLLCKFYQVILCPTTVLAAVRTDVKHHIHAVMTGCSILFYPHME